MAHDHEIFMTLADTAMEMRDLSALQEYAPSLQELAERDRHKLYLGIALRALGVAQRLDGKHIESKARLKQALDLFTKLGARWQMARTLFELGEWNLTQPEKKVQAREYFSLALSLFDEIQAVPNAERTREALRSLD